MPKINYKNIVILKIMCNQDSQQKCFVEYTSNMRNFKYNLRRDCLKNRPGILYETINQCGGIDQCKIDIIETDCDCNNMDDVRKRLLYWKEKLLTPEMSPNQHKIAQNSTKLAQNSTFLHILATPDCLSCDRCGKQFSRKSSVQRHSKKCMQVVVSQHSPEEIDSLRADFKAELASLKQQLKEYMNTVCKMHPRTLNKLNNRIKQQNANNTNSNNNIQGNTINNQQITIVELGKENLSEFFTKEQQMQILNKRYNCIDYLIETVHFNNKNKQFQNVAITNVHDRYAYKYVEKEKRFIMVNKESLMDDMMSYRIEDIREFFENQQGLSETTYNAVKRFLKDMDEDEKKLEQKTCDIKLIMYNKRDMLELTL